MTSRVIRPCSRIAVGDLQWRRPLHSAETYGQNAHLAGYNPKGSLPYGDCQKSQDSHLGCQAAPAMG